MIWQQCLGYLREDIHPAKKQAMSRTLKGLRCRVKESFSVSFPTELRETFLSICPTSALSEEERNLEK